MNKQSIVVGRKQVDGTVQPISRSTVLQPRIQFKGGDVPWYDDSRHLKNKINKH